MSLRALGNVAVGYSASMDKLSAGFFKDPDNIKDPGKLAMFNINMQWASQGYQLTARSIQDIQKEDQILNELLRDA